MGIVIAPMVHGGEFFHRRFMWSLEGAAYGLLPCLGFCGALILLPRISETTGRPYMWAVVGVAVLSVWPLPLLESWPMQYVAFVSALNPAFLFTGAVTVLLAIGVLERA